MSESLITKKALAAALKELTKHKTFEKITISDIAKQCGVNRQTFYYHFQDKYELVNWIYSTEAFEIISDDLSFNLWVEKIIMLLKKMQSEAYFYQNTLINGDTTEFENYFVNIAKALFIRIIQAIDSEKRITNEDLNFIAEFYSFGIVGIIVSWAKNGMKIKPENIARHLEILVKDSKQFSVNKYLHDQKTSTTN